MAGENKKPTTAETSSAAIRPPVAAGVACPPKADAQHTTTTTAKAGPASTGRKKRKPKLSRKQRKLVKALPESNSISEAGRSAGYFNAQSAHRAMQAIERKFPEIMDKHGLTDDYLVEKCIKPGLEANETKFFQHEGEVTDQRDVINWTARHSYLETSLRMKGAFPKNGNGDKGATIGVAVQLVVLDGERAEELGGRLSGSRGGRALTVDAEVHSDP